MISLWTYIYIYTFTYYTKYIKCIDPFIPILCFFRMTGVASVGGAWIHRTWKESWKLAYTSIAGQARRQPESQILVRSLKAARQKVKVTLGPPPKKKHMWRLRKKGFSWKIMKNENKTQEVGVLL